MKPASREGDPQACAVTDWTPHQGGPIAVVVPPEVLVGHRQASAVGDTTHCTGSTGNVIEGSATVLVGGMPMARLGVQTSHGGVVVGGDGSVLVGGPSYVQSPVIRIEGTDEFRNKVARDLYFLSQTRSGKELFARLEAVGKSVTILETHWPGSSTDFDHQKESMRLMRGEGIASVIQYNADLHKLTNGPRDQVIAQPPQLVLAHELVHALAQSESRVRYPRTDPRAPPTERNMNEREAVAIGVGSHEDDFPTENTFRDDLGLPRRVNHKQAHTTESVPQIQLRPGHLR